MKRIDDLREEMEEVTMEMIKLFKKRTSIAEKIGHVKKELGVEITDNIREVQLQNEVFRVCDRINLDREIGSKFLNFLLNESVKVQLPEKKTHLAIFQKAKELERKGKEIIHLEVGEPNMQPSDIVKKSLQEVFDKGYGKYGPVKGIQQLREAIAQNITFKTKDEIKSENIMVCPGARFGVFASITTLLNPGEEIIVIEPAWPAYKECAMNAGIRVRRVKTDIKNNWEPSIDVIKEVINENTKMIVLNYPNNPTGKILSNELQEKIVNLARENDLYILSDEIYSQYAEREVRSIIEYNYQKSIVTQSFSKSHSMTGYRIGYVIADREIIDKISKLQALCLTNVSEPIQYVALKALEADTGEFSKIIRKRLELIIQKAKEMNLEFVKPDGAMYVFARTSKNGVNFTDMAEKLLEDGVAIAPGEGFGEYKEFFRISAGVEEEKIIKGMNILDSKLRRYYD